MAVSRARGPVSRFRRDFPHVQTPTLGGFHPSDCPKRTASVSSAKAPKTSKLRFLPKGVPTEKNVRRQKVARLRPGSNEPPRTPNLPGSTALRPERPLGVRVLHEGLFAMLARVAQADCVSGHNLIKNHNTGIDALVLEFRELWEFAENQSVPGDAECSCKHVQYWCARLMKIALDYTNMTTIVKGSYAFEAQQACWLRPLLLDFHFVLHELAYFRQREATGPDVQGFYVLYFEKRHHWEPPVRKRTRAERDVVYGITRKDLSSVLERIDSTH